MAVKALSYIGVNSDKLEDWSDYSEKCLGMQKVDRGKGTLSFRMDDQILVKVRNPFRFVILFPRDVDFLTTFRNLKPIPEWLV